MCPPDSYTWDFNAYSGQPTTIQSFGHAESILIKLSEKLVDAGWTIYADNFYTSLPLREYMLTNKTYYCGSLQSNCKYIPKDIVNKKLKIGDIVSKQNEKGVKNFNWKDKRNVLTLSIVPECTDTVVPTGKKVRSGEEILKPSSVIEYNKAKKGVDMSDQMLMYHTAPRKKKEVVPKTCHWTN